jgi:hypothetical protein
MTRKLGMTAAGAATDQAPDLEAEADQVILPAAPPAERAELTPIPTEHDQ